MKEEPLPPELLAQIRHWPEQDFTCACCRQHVDCRWNPVGTRRQFPPICNECELVSGYDWTGRARYRSRPSGGSHMDRRNATRIIALAEILADTAKRIQGKQNHGNP